MWQVRVKPRKQRRELNQICLHRRLLTGVSPRIELVLTTSTQNSADCRGHDLLDRPQQLPHLKIRVVKDNVNRVIVQSSNVVLHGDKHDIQSRFLLRGITVNENLEHFLKISDQENRRCRNLATHSKEFFTRRESDSVNIAIEENNSTMLRHLFKADLHLVP